MRSLCGILSVGGTLISFQPDFPLFITGTDTNVGKTFFGAWLLEQWLKGGASAGKALGFKPICSGGREDAEAYAAVRGHELSLAEINPLSFRAPLSPLAAARLEGRPDGLALPELQRLNQHVSDIAQARKATHVLVEGVGGWLVPLGMDKGRRLTVSDWAKQLGYPVVVVARSGLGTLNHTLLTVESIRAAGLTCAGIVLNEGVEELQAVGQSALRTAVGGFGSMLGLNLGAPLSPESGASSGGAASAGGIRDAARVNGAILVSWTGLPVFHFTAGAEGVGLLPVWLSGKQA